MPCSARRRPARRSPRACRARDARAMTALRRRRSPTGCRDRRPGARRVVAALAARPPDRMDRRQVDDVEAELAKLGTCAATPANPPKERGKSSYQEPKRARTRSTSTIAAGAHLRRAERAAWLAQICGQLARRAPRRCARGVSGRCPRASRPRRARRSPSSCWRRASHALGAEPPRRARRRDRVSPAATLRVELVAPGRNRSVQARRPPPQARLSDDEMRAPAILAVLGPAAAHRRFAPAGVPRAR